jgi:hypothetical protein
MIRGLLFVLGSLAMTGDWGSTADFVKQWVASAAYLAVVVFGVVRVVRMNLQGYFLVLAIPTALVGCEELLSQPNSFYQQQGSLVLTVLAALLAWPVVGWLSAEREAT